MVRSWHLTRLQPCLRLLGCGCRLLLRVSVLQVLGAKLGYHNGCRFQLGFGQLQRAGRQHERQHEK